MDIVGLSETKRPGSGEISSRDFTYYWSGMSNSGRLRGVAIAVSSRLQPSVVEVIPIDERIMRLRLKHTWGFMSLVAVYVPTEAEVCWADEKEMFYAKIDFILDQCPRWDDLNAVTDTDRVICWSPWLWYQEHQQLSPSEFCKIQKIENCRFLVSKTRAVPLNLV